MNESKTKLLNYISDNYEDVVKSAIGGEYIEIDLIPNGHEGLHDLNDLAESCRNQNIDFQMFINNYPKNIGDGIRMGRYFYFMQETTKSILEDLKVSK